jgi:O-antigen/teichoic acid export membrane protein
MRFIYDEQTTQNIGKPVFNGLIIFNSSLFLYTITAIVLWLLFDIQYIGYIYVYGVCLTVNNLLGYLARALGHSKLFATTGVISTLVTSSLNVIGIAFLRGGIEVLYISTIVGLLVQIVLLERSVKIRDHISFRFYDKDILGRLFRYSIPLSLNSLAYWLLTGYTSVMISHMLGLESNGIYMVAAKFGVAINLLATCFNLAWQEIAFKKGNDDKAELSRFYSRAINVLINFFGVGGALLIPVCYIIFPFFVKGDYVASHDLIPLYIIVSVFSVVSSFLGQTYAAIKATKVIMYSTLTACVVNLLLVPVFIVFIGLKGAIIGMMISSLVNVVMRIVILRRYVTISLKYKNLLSLLPLMIVAFITFYSGSLWSNILLCILILGLSLYVFRDFFKPIVEIIKSRKND